MYTLEMPKRRGMLVQAACFLGCGKFSAIMDCGNKVIQVAYQLRDDSLVIIKLY